MLYKGQHNYTVAHNFVKSVIRIAIIIIAKMRSYILIATALVLIVSRLTETAPVLSATISNVGSCQNPGQNGLGLLTGNISPNLHLYPILKRIRNNGKRYICVNGKWVSTIN